MRRLIVVALLSLGIMFGSTGTALATHCYVADKPDGAGVRTDGNGNGAFIVEDSGNFFKKDLPEPAHDNGSDTHGVLEVED